jgi:hypothetical protein
MAAPFFCTFIENTSIANKYLSIHIRANCPLLLSDFNQNYTASTYFIKTPQYKISGKFV